MVKLDVDMFPSVSGTSSLSRAGARAIEPGPSETFAMPWHMLKRDIERILPRRSHAPMTEIRQATIDDARAIAEVQVATWRMTYRGMMPDALLDNLHIEDREERARQFLADPAPEARTYVVDVDHHVVGFASAGSERTGNTTYTGELYALYVLQRFQGKGFGRELMRAAASHLRRHGHRSLWVWVLAQNPARNFYRRMGGLELAEQWVERGGARLREVGLGWADIDQLAFPEGGRDSPSPEALSR